MVPPKQLPEVSDQKIMVRNNSLNHKFMKLKEIIAFANNKGGVAKTTTVQNVAAGLLRRDPSLRILCIDLDPQGNLSSLLGWRD